MKKEPTIIFYSDNYTPLSADCYGCYHFGYVCEGSVYRTECPTGQVEDIRPSIVASLLLRATNNRFILARSFGYDIATLVDDDINEKLRQEYEEALKTPDEVIENYKKMYSLDIYSEREIHEIVQHSPKPETKEQKKHIEEESVVLDSDDLPF